MPPDQSDLTIVHVEDDKSRSEKLVHTCGELLQIPTQNILWRRSIDGASTLFRELAEQRAQVAAVVCNGEILTTENAEDETDKMGGRFTHRMYQELTSGEGMSVREAIGSPPWLHNTSSPDHFRDILNQWNSDGPNEDVQAGAHKLFEDSGVAAGLAIVMHVRGVLGIDDPRVQWAMQEFCRDAASADDLNDQLVYFLPSVHAHMKNVAPEKWLDNDEYWNRG